jgi:hypothetical protein
MLMKPTSASFSKFQTRFSSSKSNWSCATIIAMISWSHSQEISSWWRKLTSTERITTSCISNKRMLMRNLRNFKQVPNFQPKYQLAYPLWPISNSYHSSLINLLCFPSITLLSFQTTEYFSSTIKLPLQPPKI